jgi:hypothetical protein
VNPRVAVTVYCPLSGEIYWDLVSDAPTPDAAARELRGDPRFPVPVGAVVRAWRDAEGQ